MIPIRPTDKGKLRFFCGDASREGFRGATQYPNGTLSAREGLWDPQFQNQVTHLLHEIRAGKHDGCEVWAAIDNSVWSAVWNKGMSQQARHLFYLVITLKQEARDHEVYLRCFHISGARMIACGVDGLLRWNYDAGISLGLDIRQFMPLHLLAWDIAGDTLAGWCKSWMGMDYSPPLSPVGWFPL
jgi:hypothetical protein